jgi:hypothetical protein
MDAGCDADCDADVYVAEYCDEADRDVYEADWGDADK